MKLLVAAHSYPPAVSGVGEVVRQLAEGLSRRGHDVHIATGWQPGCERREQRAGVTVHRFRASGNRVVGLHGEIAAYRSLLGEGWDCLVWHCAQSWTTDAALPLWGKLRAGKVFVGHGFSALQRPGYLAYFDTLAAALRQVDRIVALSGLLEETPFCAAHGLPDPAVVPNGVDADLFAARDTDVRAAWGVGGSPWVLSVSNHSPVKGHRLFFELLDGLAHEFPRVHGTIVGAPYGAERFGLGRLGIKGGCWYRCRAAALGNRRVSLRAAVPRADVVAAIQQADAVVITSSREAYPLVALESMAAGTPWVSTPVGAVAEIAGGVVARDRTSLLEAVSSVLRDAELRSRLATDGRRAVAAHRWEEIVSRHEAIYASACSGPREVRRSLAGERASLEAGP